jgi:hypothetical protein
MDFFLFKKTCLNQTKRLKSIKKQTKGVFVLKKVNLLDRLGELPLKNLQSGLIEENNYISCIFCGFEAEKGVVFKDGERFLEAEKYVKAHIERAHGSVFSALIALGKKSTGLSDHQAELLKRFYVKIPDEQIQKELLIGSKSTIRNHRFVLKEKERQARIFMTLMQLIRDNETNPGKYIKPHSTATMVDDRYKVTVTESEKLLKKYFPDGLDGPLKTFTMKEKAKVVVLRHISQRFEPQIKYSEKQVDEILKAVFADHVTLRRYLIEYGFLDRTQDCSQYWLKF